MNVLRMTRKREKIIGEKLSDVIINGSLEEYKMCHDLGVPSVLNLKFCFVCLQLFSGCCDQSFHVFFDWEKKSPAAGSMCMTGMFKLSMNELEPFYTHQTLSVIFYRGGLWIFHYVLYYNTYIVARWDNLCFRTTLQCCTAGVTPLYQYLMDSGMKHYNQLWENITYAN